MQQSKLRHGVDLLVATPGRLIDFIYSRKIDLSAVRILVLDEADEMLSMGFYEDLEFIIQCLVHEHQTLLFSATMPPQIRKIAMQHMKNPKEISLVSEQASPSTIDHQFLYCHHEQKISVLIKQVQELNPKTSDRLLPVQRGGGKIRRHLSQKFHGVDFLHAGLSQRRAHPLFTGKFRSGKISLLVATDVATRGLDFSGITHVFIYHLADDPDIYLRRSGRTGRQERQGTMVTLVTDRELHSIKERAECDQTRSDLDRRAAPSKPRTSRPRNLRTGTRFQGQGQSICSLSLRKGRAQAEAQARIAFSKEV